MDKSTVIAIVIGTAGIGLLLLLAVWIRAGGERVDRVLAAHDAERDGWAVMDEAFARDARLYREQQILPGESRYRP